MIPCVLFILFITIARFYTILSNSLAVAATIQPTSPSTNIITSLTTSSLINSPQTTHRTTHSGIYSYTLPPISKSSSLVGAIADSTDLISTTSPPPLTSTTITNRSASAGVENLLLISSKVIDDELEQPYDETSSTSPLPLLGSNALAVGDGEKSNHGSPSSPADRAHSGQASMVTTNEGFMKSHNLLANNKPATPITATIITNNTYLDKSQAQRIQQQTAYHQVPSSIATQQIHQPQSHPVARNLSPYVQQTEGKDTPVWSVQSSEVINEYPTVPSNSKSNNESKDTTTKAQQITSTTATAISKTIQSYQGRNLATISFSDPTPSTVSATQSRDTQYLTTTANGQTTPFIDKSLSIISSYDSARPSKITGIEDSPTNSHQKFATTLNQFIPNSEFGPIENLETPTTTTSSTPTNMINILHYSNSDNNGSGNGTILNSNLSHGLITNDQNYLSNNASIISPNARSVCVAYLCSFIFVNKTFEECDQDLCASSNGNIILDKESFERAKNHVPEEKFAMIELASGISPLSYHQESILAFTPTLTDGHQHQNDEKFMLLLQQQQQQQQRQQQATVILDDENKQQQKFFKHSQNNQILTPAHSKTKLDLYNNKKFRQQQATSAPQLQFNNLQLQQEPPSASIVGWIPITIPPLSSLGSFSFSSSSFPSDQMRQQQTHSDQSYPRQPQDNHPQTHNRHNHYALQQQETMPNHESYLEFPTNDNMVGRSNINKEKTLTQGKTTSSPDSDSVMSSLTATRIIRPHQRPQQQIANKYEAVSTTLSELLSSSLLHSQLVVAPSDILGSSSTEIDSEITLGGGITNSPIQSVIMRNKNLQQIKHRYKLQPQKSGPMFSSVSSQATTIPANFLNKNNDMTSQSMTSDDNMIALPNGNKCQATSENLGPKGPIFPATSTSINSNQASVSMRPPVSFMLYTRCDRGTNFNGNDVSSPDGEELNLSDDTTIDRSHLNKSYPIKIIIHGFGSGGKRPWVIEMACKLLEFDKVNVIVVDWEKGAALPNYVQAAGNTRFVGHCIACLIKIINSKFGLSGDNYHLIGFSLGAHVAGYAGMEIRNSTNNGKHWINRITGLDPASPLFEGYETYQRLDPSDAQFVDVIHSNGDGVLRGGLGSLQPMGHVDFYPNGGRVQVGCNSVILSALSDIIYGKWQTLCNHRRALNFFMDTLETNRCKFRSFNCESYESYLRGECFECGINHEKCSEMGYSTNRTQGRGKMYLTTSETGPFCANQLVIELIGTRGYSTYWGKVEVVLLTSDGKNETYLLSTTNQQVGDDNSDDYVGHVQSLIVAQATLNNFTHVLLRYTKYKGWIYSGQENWSIDKLSLTDSDGQVKSYCGHNTLLGSQLLTKLRLEAHNCSIEVSNGITKQPYIPSPTQTAISQNPIITTRSGGFLYGSTNAYPPMMYPPIYQDNKY